MSLVTPVDPLVGEAGHHAENPPARQHRLLRLIFRADRDSQDRQVRHGLVHTRRSGGWPRHRPTAPGHRPAVRRSPGSAPPVGHGRANCRSRVARTSAAKVSAGLSHRASSGHSGRTCWTDRRSRRISAEMTCQRVWARSHGTTAGPAIRTNWPGDRRSAASTVPRAAAESRLSRTAWPMLFSQLRRHRVADLAERRRRWASEPEPVRERLQPGGLADSQGPVLAGMDVPVTVLGDVRRDGPRQPVLIKPLVLVVEDVVAVPLHLRWQIVSSGSSRPSARKRACRRHARAG